MSFKKYSSALALLLATGCSSVPKKTEETIFSGIIGGKSVSYVENIKSSDKRDSTDGLENMMIIQTDNKTYYLIDTQDRTSLESPHFGNPQYLDFITITEKGSNGFIMEFYDAKRPIKNSSDKSLDGVLFDAGDQDYNAFRAEIRKMLENGYKSDLNFSK